MTRALCTCLLLAIAPSLAGAQDQALEPTAYAATGAAEGHGEDARIAALDRAFAAAVDRGLAEILSPEALETHRDQLRVEIIRHARLYIASYKVLDERTIDGETRVDIEARVKLDGLRGAIAGLGLLAPLANPTGVSGAARPRLVILLAEAGPAGQRTSFGSTGTDDIDALESIAARLRERGFDLVSAAGTRVTRVTTTEEAGGAVLADAAALDLARQLGAGAAVVIGLESVSDGRVRGTHFVGARVVGAARLLEASGRTIATAEVQEAGWGEDPVAATARASLMAADQLGPVLARAAARRWPAAVAGSAVGRVPVAIKGASSWAPVAAVIRQLALTKGIDAVHPREVRGAAVTLDVETALPASQVVRAIRKARVPNGTSLQARTSGSGVTVEVR